MTSKTRQSKCMSFCSNTRHKGGCPWTERLLCYSIHSFPCINLSLSFPVMAFSARECGLSILPLIVSSTFVEAIAMQALFHRNWLALPLLVLTCYIIMPEVVYTSLTRLVRSPSLLKAHLRFTSRDLKLRKCWLVLWFTSKACYEDINTESLGACRCVRFWRQQSKGKTNTDWMTTTPDPSASCKSNQNKLLNCLLQFSAT